MKQIPLFETPVFIAQATNHDAIKHYVDTEVVPAYLENTGRPQNSFDTFHYGAVTGGSMKHLSIVDTIKKTGKQSDDNGLTSVYSDYFEGALKTDQKRMINWYAPDIQKLMTHIGFKAKDNWTFKGYFWYAITEKNGSQDTHDHITGPNILTFCGIHYVDFDEKEHSPAYFTNPNEQIIRSSYPSENAEVIPDYFKQICKAPICGQGDIVWFPPWLKHTVARQQSAKRRIAIAMNITVEQKNSMIQPTGEFSAN